MTMLERYQDCKLGLCSVLGLIASRADMECRVAKYLH